MSTAEQMIVDYICERGPYDPPTVIELAGVAPSDTDIAETLAAMVAAGQVEKFEDQERGTVYTRDC